MVVTKESVQEAMPVEAGVPNVIIVKDFTETVGGSLKVLIPYIEAGYSHVVRDTYHDCFLATEPLEVSYEDAQKVKACVSPGTLVTLESGTRVTVYTVDLEEEE